MPAGYLFSHLLLVGVIAWVASRMPVSSRAFKFLGLLLLGSVTAGFALERRSEWAWSAMRLGIPDLVFFTNLTLEGVAALIVVMWRQAANRGSRLRAALFTPVLVGASLWSYAWIFAPVPPGLHGTVNKSGYCAQTSDYSCSAAAAAMLLEANGISASEAEMAALCVTRSGHGTSPLGLYRGLVLKSRAHGVQPVLVHARTPAGVRAIGGPSIASVGLEVNAPVEVSQRMEGYGWRPGVKHAVVFLDADPKGAWIDVADPSYGRERWPTGDSEELASIWDGLALTLRPVNSDQAFKKEMSRK